MTEKNLFADATTPEEAVYQALGAGSGCWTDQIIQQDEFWTSYARVFNEQQAHRVADDLLARLAEFADDEAHHERVMADTAPATFWNGIPAPCRRGTAVVADNPDRPLYWARELVGQRIPIVEVSFDGVTHGGGTDYLDNRDGSGWLKVTEGHGGPRYGHRSAAIVPGSFVTDGDDQ